MCDRLVPADLKLTWVVDRNLSLTFWFKHENVLKGADSTSHILVSESIIKRIKCRSFTEACQWGFWGVWMETNDFLEGVKTLYFKVTILLCNYKQVTINMN